MRRGRPASAACSSSQAWRLPLLLLLGLMCSVVAAAAAARFSSSSRGVGGGACLFVAPIRAPTNNRAFAAPAPASPLSRSSSSIGTGSAAPAAHRFVVPRPQQRAAAAGSSLVRRAALPPTALQDVGGAALVAGAAGVWLKLWTTLATAGKVDSKDSRKIIHCGSGPLFLLCWPFFSADPSARFFAAAVPLLQIVAVSLAGLSKSSSPSTTTTTNLPSTTTTTKPDGLVAAISRSGNPAEVLRGPLIYVFILLFATLLFWRTSPVGLVAVAQMAAGDGMADIVGRRWGRERKWPFSATKSYAGTAAFVVFGFLVSLGLLAWFHLFGLVPALTADVVFRVAAISVACALVELVPLGDDNVTVPVAAAALSTLLLR